MGSWVEPENDGGFVGAVRPMIVRAGDFWFDAGDGRALMPDTDITKSYHAHVYYTPATRAAAEAVREGIESRFQVPMGRWREEPVGPHPQSMYQVAFETDQFDRLVPWLMLNRQGLDVLVHPNTGESRTDHETRALWLGQKLSLKLDGLD